MQKIRSVNKTVTVKIYASLWSAEMVDAFILNNLIVRKFFLVVSKSALKLRCDK